MMENYEIMKERVQTRKKKCSINDEREDNESAFF